MLLESKSDFSFFYNIYLGKRTLVSNLSPHITVYIMYIQSGYIAVILSILVGANILIYWTKYCTLITHFDCHVSGLSSTMNV